MGIMVERLNFVRTRRELLVLLTTSGGDLEAHYPSGRPHHFPENNDRQTGDQQA